MASVQTEVLAAAMAPQDALPCALGTLYSSTDVESESAQCTVQDRVMGPTDPMPRLYGDNFVSALSAAQEPVTTLVRMISTLREWSDLQ